MRSGVHEFIGNRKGTPRSPQQIVTVLRGDRQGKDDAPTHTLSEAAPLPTPSPWTLPATEPCPGSMNLHTFASPAAHSCIRFWTINSWRVAPGAFSPRASAGSVHASGASGFSRLPEPPPPGSRHLPGGRLSASASPRPGLKAQIPVLRLSGSSDVFLLL